MLSRHAYISGILLSLILVSMAGAQLGEVAGQPHVKVSIGGHNTTTVTLLNTGSTPITFQSIAPTFTPSNSGVVPNVTISPIEATIPPKQDMNVNITVSLSRKNVQPNDSWVGSPSL